ncbi:DUF3368 domain-containing protein [Parapedobacter soli]|uniref:DUF3368 domain-containing protein n=1 Tax=Parapedobacter soli TaxID=416955 RepID=UPI0021C6FCAC|nr:DUF3368 domain-containing protein [Parapedobacter soli]
MGENKVVITDTSCFILLTKIDALDVLKELFTTVFTTPEIAEEFGDPLPEWVIVKPVTNRKTFHSYLGKVDRGEASALVLADEIHADLLVIDDMKARKFAQKIGFTLKGTLGLLIMARQEGVITELRPYLGRVQRTNFRVAKSLIEQCLRIVGER